MNADLRIFTAYLHLITVSVLTRLQGYVMRNGGRKIWYSNRNAEIDWRTQLYFDYLTQRTTASLRQGHHPQTPLKCRLHAFTKKTVLPESMQNRRRKVKILTWHTEGKGSNKYASWRRQFKGLSEVLKVAASRNFEVSKFLISDFGIYKVIFLSRSGDGISSNAASLTAMTEWFYAVALNVVICLLRLRKRSVLLFQCVALPFRTTDSFPLNGQNHIIKYQQNAHKSNISRKGTYNKYSIEKFGKRFVGIILRRTEMTWSKSWANVLKSS